MCVCVCVCVQQVKGYPLTWALAYKGEWAYVRVCVYIEGERVYVHVCVYLEGERMYVRVCVYFKDERVYLCACMCVYECMSWAGGTERVYV